MYLWKQWRESRIASGIGMLGLALVVALAITIYRTSDAKEGMRGSLDAFSIIVFYVQAILIGCWAWFLGSIGIGKNLGEGSGSFLFTRPRSRTWFLWKDWAFGIALQAGVIMISNLIVGFLCYRLVSVRHFAPPGLRLIPPSEPPSLIFLFSLIGMGVLFFSGLVYSLTYISTLVVKRASAVMLSAGICIGYLVLLVLVRRYYPSVHLPNPFLTLFNFHQKTIYGFSDHLGVRIAAHALVILLFPLTGMAVLKRSEL